MKIRSFAVVDKSFCVACGSCTKVCIKGAISVVNGIHADIEKSKCVACSLCVKACPASVIEIA